MLDIITHPIHVGTPNEIHFNGHPFVKFNTTEFQRRYGDDWQHVMKSAVNDLLTKEWSEDDQR